MIGRKITSAEEMIDAAKEISEKKYHCAVLCKGGHNLNDANDLLYADGAYRWFNGKELIIRILMVQVVHCLLRLLLILQKGFSLEESVERAKRVYLWGTCSNA